MGGPETLDERTPGGRPLCGFGSLSAAPRAGTESVPYSSRRATLFPAESDSYSEAMSYRLPFLLSICCAAEIAVAQTASAENWPRWRGPRGNAVTAATGLPVEWGVKKNVRWKTALPGEGSSSPVVFGERIFLTSAEDDGTKRIVRCLDRHTGRIVWTKSIGDKNPEPTSALTGHAAATPVTDGKRVIAFFGNAGAVCYDFAGKRLWRRSLGEFESELGFASSPVLVGDRVILVCDHDGDRFSTFDSFLIALDAQTGKTAWKTQRRGLFRSWSTPIVVVAGAGPMGSPAGRKAGRKELLVCGQDALRAYDPDTGRELWKVTGLTGWVTPTPVFAEGLILLTCGKTGPVLAVRPGGTGDVTKSHVVWKHERQGPYVCSPVCYGGLLYVHNEAGLLSCYEARTGTLVYRKRLGGRFYASSIAGDGRVYISNDAGRTHVIRAGRRFEVLARNELKEEILASPAVAGNDLLLRTRKHLYCIAGKQK
jgi:outer membrane protein assembly factor BamB